MSPTRRPLFLSARSFLGEVDLARAENSAAAERHQDLLDLTLTRPEQVGLSPPAWEELFSKDVPAYVPEARGLPEARRALVHLYERRAPLSEEQIVLTASTSESYFLLLLSLCDPGDAVLVPSPSYPLFSQLAQLSGVRLCFYRIHYDGAFHVDLASLPSRKEVEDQRIRAVFCVSPNNPTGNHLTLREWERLSSLGIPLLIDEVFLAYSSEVDLFDPLAPPFAQSTNTIILDGLSKRALCPGLKCGWMIVSGPEKELLLERLDWVLDTFLSVGNPVMHALSSVLAQAPAAQSDVRARLKENRGLLRTVLADSALTPLRVDGGWSAILRLPATQTEQDWERELSRAGLRLHYGSMYGFEDEPLVILSLLVRPEDLKRGLDRLLALVP